MSSMQPLCVPIFLFIVCFFSIIQYRRRYHHTTSQQEGHTHRSQDTI